MGERALGWGFRLLGLFLMVGPFIIALGTHNWDIVAAVLPSQEEMAGVQNMLTGMFGGGFTENTFTVESPTLSGTTIRATARFNSPFKFTIRITDLSGYVTCGEHGTRLAQVSMEESSVEIPSQGAGTFTIVGQPTTEGTQHMLDSHLGALPTSIGFENASATFDFYGLTVRLQISTMQGG